jgi:menaquinone-dependent protoporphyrinogen oxidase
LSNTSRHPASLPVGFPERALGDSASSKRILVAYASAAGSTGAIAETVGRALAGAAVAVDVRRVQSVSALDGYAAVVLGSAVHGGRWLPEAVEFLRANRSNLGRVPVAFFLAGLMVNRQSPSDRQLVDQFLAAERALVKPVAEGRFLGAFFARDYPAFVGLGMRLFSAYCGLGFGGGDFRDPDAIRAWAEGIRPLLSP